MADAAVSGSRPVAPSEVSPTYFWPLVLCLLGVDYFSTLAYQPSITYQVAGALGPLATVGVVLLTLFGALPVYWYVAGRSPLGHGSLGLLERLVRGWRGKTMILVLLGFAATDFVMLKSMSGADAAVHVLGNEFAPWQKSLTALAHWGRDQGQQHLGEGATDFFSEQVVTTILLGALAFVFWFLLRKGFTRNVLWLSVPLVTMYLILNAVILGAGLWHLADHPDHLAGWWDAVRASDHHPVSFLGPCPWWLGILILCVISLPHLALGLSGFEMSLILMPQVRGLVGEKAEDYRGRIRNTRKVLVCAALIMSTYLLASALVTCLLIPAAELDQNGNAANRALAYLAHGGRLTTGATSLGEPFGTLFGTLYDLVTVLLLMLAGTSVVTALAVYLPRFLLRFGMEFPWMHRWGFLLVLFALVNLAVTLYFRASVTAQRSAYATAVLVLMCSAAAVAALNCRRAGKNPWYLVAIALVFGLSGVAVIADSPIGVLIAGGFILTILALSVFSRAFRANELRTIGFRFKDEQSRFLWDSLRLADFPVLVPHRPGRQERIDKEIQIRRDHNLAQEVDVVFLEIELEDPSDFEQNLLVEVFQEDHRFILRVERCVSVAHAIAAIALEMSRQSKPPGLHFGWSELNLLSASWGYLAFGEGNVPAKVRELIHLAEPDANKRPRVIVG